MTNKNLKTRIVINRSNRAIYIQFVDDNSGKVLLSKSTLKDESKNKPIDKAFELGKAAAAEALKLKIKEVVFDRNGLRYHGQVMKVAEGLREGGIKI